LDDQAVKDLPPHAKELVKGPEMNQMNPWRDSLKTLVGKMWDMELS
jgi:hypothetical protein